MEDKEHRGQKEAICKGSVVGGSWGYLGNRMRSGEAGSEEVRERLDSKELDVDKE